jgi:tRNA A-37 threonylcarbamoyl transferase component Bud32
MSATPPVHPSPDQLARFGRGDLEATEWAAIEGHVQDCPSCGRALKALPDDAFVARLRTCLADSDSPEQSTPDVSGAGSPTRTEAGSTGPLPVEVPAWLAAHPRYRVLGLLGAGGMGAVYKAEHQVMARTVALKVLNRGLLDNPATVERFRREARAAAQLSHPNIVTAHDAEQASDSHLLVMEYVEGVSLARLIAEKGPLPVHVACDYIRQAALGLQHAFEKGMVHRDIKPANLMLTPSGQVKILDFGLARLAFDSPPVPSAGPEEQAGGLLTQVGTVMGTPDYIAPEQAVDAHAADIRADIYSLGCTLYDLLAGQPPFPEGTAVDKVLAHTRQQPRPLTTVRKDVPRELARVVAKMMAKDPTQRYDTPAEVAGALQRFVLPALPSPIRGCLFALAALIVCLTLLAVGLERIGLGALPLVLGGMLLVRRFPRLRFKTTPSLRQRLSIATPALLLIVLGFLLFLFVPPFRRGRILEWSPLSPQGIKPPLAVESAAEVRRFTGHLGAVKCVAFTPDGGRALSASGFPTADDTVRVWDVANGRQLVRFRGHEGPVHTVAVSPDGLRALSGGADRVVRLWDVATAKEVRRFEGHTSLIGSVAFSPNGRRALSGAADRTVRLWDVDTGRELKRFEGHTAQVVAVAFVDDGRALSGSFDRTMCLWDLKTGRELKRFPGHQQTVSGIAVSPDGRRALSGSDGVRLWDLGSGQQLRHFEDSTGHVESVAFSSDGRRALVGGMDNLVRLWDLETGEKLASFQGHTLGVWNVAISPDGRFGLSGGGDTTVRLWQLPAPGP